MDDDYRIGQEYETSVTVQQVLETISDTILQIVLFQVEAKENVSYLVNLNVKPLIESMKILVELAKKKTEKWTGKEEEKNKVNMLRACDTMTKAMNTIEKSLEILGKDIYHKKAKDELLWASRTVVQCTVTLLQIADNYDIRKIIYGCKAAEEEQKKIMELEDMGQLPELIRRYIYEVVNLAKTVESRCNYIPDPILSKKYREANKVVAELPEPLIQMYVGGKTQNNEQFIETARDHDKKLKEAYKELIKLSKLSSQEMFAGIDLDLNPLDDDDPNRKLQANTVTMNDLGKKLQGYLEENNPKKVLQTVQEIQDKGNEQLRLGKDAENKETDPNKKDLLHAAAGNLANALKNMMENAKKYAENPVEENKKKVFQSIDSVLNSSDNMKRTQDMPDHFDKASENVALMLANLGDLVKFGTEKEAVEGVKKVISGIQEQVKQAQNVKFERAPNQKKAMQTAVEEMKPILQDLLSSTKGVLSNKTGQNAPKFLQAFEVALENADKYSKKIESLTHPEKNVDFVETPNDKLLGVARRVENAIDELLNAGVEKIVPKFKDLNTVVGEEIILAKEMGFPKESQKLQKVLDGLTNPIRNYAKDPKNPNNIKELDVALNNIKNAQQELLEVALTPKELAMHSGIGLKKHGADLIDAIRSGDTKRIPSLLEDVQRDLNSQAQALRMMPVDGELAKEYEKLATEQEQLSKKLPVEVEKSVKTKNLTPVNAILDKANDNSKKILSFITPDIEGDLISHTAKLNNAMNMLKASKEVGDDQTAQNVLDEIMDLLKGDDILCSMLGGKTFNKKLKQTLLDCGQEIADILSKLAENGGNIANLDLNQIGDMLIRVKKLNDLILGTTGDPVEKIAQIGEQIENLIDNLEFPVNPTTQTVLSSIVDGLEQQILLADLVGKEHPDRKDHLDQAVEKAKRHLESLKPSVIEVFNDLEDKNAQKRLQNILFDTKEVSADIVDASQPPHWERVISNCNSLARDLPLLSENIKKGNKTVALNLLENISNKMNSQGHLIMSGAKKISNEKLKKDLQEAGTEQEIIGSGFYDLGKNRIEGSDWSFTAKFNSTYNKSTKLNETILALAKKALSGGEEELEEIEETEQENTANQLGVISLKVRKVAQELQVDDSPKGQMFGCTKEIGKLLEVLSNAAKSGDKGEMIRTTKEIANNVQKVLTLTKSINCNQNDKDKIISFALNAKNFGTQLKILTAVKASINETDKTAENQLVTCAQQLAENVMNCVKMTDIASLKK